MASSSSSSSSREESQETISVIDSPDPVLKLKSKMSLPIRILEEEVWFSGSELKTDNSSSEDEQINQIRKSTGVRKKTKFVCKSHASTKVFTTQTTSKDSKTGTTSKIQEITTATTSTGKYDMVIVNKASDVQWRPKRGSISLPGLSSELERIQI